MRLSRTFTFVLALLSISLEMQAADYATFEAFYESGGIGLLGWGGIILGSLIVAAVTFVTFGGGAAAAPAWVAAVGSWIGSSVGLSGIAAANFGLALLGGGSIAAGGLGVAGGVAVVTMAMTFGVDAALSYGVDVAMEKWSQAKYLEANKEMFTMPPPRNEKGGDAYEETIEFLSKKFITKPELGMHDPRNQAVLEQAIEKLAAKMYEETDKEYCLKDKTLLALLYLQTNKYSEASRIAKETMTLADELDEEKTLPAFIWSLSEIASPVSTYSQEIVNAQILAYIREPDNMMMPIVTSCYMDRMMFKYHHGKLPLKYLAMFSAIITLPELDEKQAARSLEIFVTRCLVELKRTKQDIHIVTSDTLMMQRSQVVEELKRRLERHRGIVTLLQKVVLEKVYALSEHFPEESKITGPHLTSLLGDYYNDLDELEKAISR